MYDNSSFQGHMLKLIRCFPDLSMHKNHLGELVQSADSWAPLLYLLTEPDSLRAEA